MSWCVRLARLSDAERICDINVGSLGYDYSLCDTRERLAKILVRPTDRIWVVCREEDGEVCGYLHAADYEVLYMGSMKNILALAVDEAFQGVGLGRLLLNAVEDWARDCGCYAVRLVSGFNRVNAHQFYLHCGYRMRKEEKNLIKELY